MASRATARTSNSTRFMCCEPKILERVVRPAAYAHRGGWRVGGETRHRRHSRDVGRRKPRRRRGGPEWDAAGRRLARCRMIHLTPRTFHAGAGASMSRSRSRRPSRRVEPAEPPPPRHRRLIGLDLGSRRIGVAISDAAGGFVAHRHVIDRRNLPDDRAAVAAVLDDYPNATILVGLPLSMDGTEGPQAVRARQWARQLLEDRVERGSVSGRAAHDGRRSRSRATGAGGCRGG